MIERAPALERWLLALFLTAGAILRLAYGAGDLDPRRFWDEAYALENVRSILVERTLKPAKSYYPSPVFNLPAAGVVRAIDGVNEALGRDPGRAFEAPVFGPDAYLALRALQAVFGVAAIFMLYRIGRRLLGPEVGLMAAAALAFSPWGIHSSGVFKPDALVLFGVLFSFDRALSVVRDPGVRTAVWAGIGIALAASGKLTGVLVALPLALGLLWPGRRPETLRPRLVALAVAGTASLVAFFAANPYGLSYPRFVQSLKRDYAMRAEWEDATKLEIPWKTGALVVDETGLGLLFGSIALIGFLWLSGRFLVGVFRRRFERDEPAGPERAMLVIFPWLYTLVYASQTSYFKPNNVLPVVAFVALGGAWLLERAARRIDRPARALGSIGFLLVVAIPGFRYVYTSFVPTCFDVARYRLKQEINQPVPRLIYYEAGIRGRAFPWEGGAPFRFAAEVEVESLDDVPPEWSAGADALLFRARRGESIEAGPHGALLGDLRRTESVTLEPAFRHAVGPSVTYWQRAWRVRRPSRTGELARCGGSEAALDCLEVRPSERVRVGEEVSLTVLLDGELVSSQSEPPSIRVGGSRLPLYATTRSGREGAVLLSPRFGWPAEPPELLFEQGDDASDGASSTGELGREPARTGVFVEIHRWRTAEATTSSRPGG